MAESEKISAAVKRLSWLPTEWAYKGFVILGLMASLWLQSHYVTRERYEADQKSQVERNNKVDYTLVSLDKSLAILIEQQKIREAQDRELADHEARLRVLENRR